jgi:hypothetical protein
MIGKPVVNYAVSALRQAVAGADPDAGTLSLVSGIPNRTITNRAVATAPRMRKAALQQHFQRSLCLQVASGASPMADDRTSAAAGSRVSLQEAHEFQY